MKAKTKYLLIGSLVIISYIFKCNFFIQRGHQKVSNIIHSEIDYIEEDLKFTKNHYHEITEIIYENNLNKEDIKNLILKAWESDAKKRNIYRKSLYKKIERIYNNLNNQNIKGLHFHFKDNTSFLRMHRPEKFGDDLTGFRETVEIVNRTSLFYSGFEEGRFFDGFRYVYPLVYNKEHIGSVEISISSNSFLERLSKLRNGNGIFILKKSTLLEKKFQDKQSNYIKTNLSDDYYYDKSVYDSKKDRKVPNKIIYKINNSIKNEFLEKKSKKKSFGILTKVNSDFYQSIFIPVNDIYEDCVAFLIFYDKCNGVNLIKKEVIHNLILLTFFMIIILFSLYWKTNLETERRNYEQEIKEANKSKDRLFSMISHDLRSPFQSILGGLSVLRDNYEDLSKKEFLFFLEGTFKDADRYYKNLSNLLDWSRSQMDGISCKPEQINIINLVYNIIDLLNDPIKNKNLDIIIKKNNFEYLYSDKNLLKTIFLNLLNNAVKFTPQKGKIFIELNKVKGKIIIKIRDTGVGIPKEKLEYLFEIKKDFSTNGTEGESGTGLGLVIVKEFLDKIGGNIEVKSELNKGTEFIIELDDNKWKNKNNI